MQSIPPDLAQSVLDAAPDAMLIIDGSGTMLFANREVFVLFGYARADLIGHLVEKLLPDRFHAGHTGHRARYVASAHRRPMGSGLELFAQRSDGSEFPVEISLSPIAMGEKTLVAAAIRDVTDRKRTEVELNEARLSAERANRSKSRFLSTASHDLRQPLQALALLNRTLKSLARDPDTSDALAQQEHTIGAMSRLLNSLLDVSKLESGAIQPEMGDFAVSSLFDELKVEFAGLAADKGLDFAVVPSLAEMHSDRSLVEELLRNLVSNAIKYTRHGSVRLHCEIIPDDALRIMVEDTGIGIASDQLPYIFDEFYQVGIASKSAREGYGLGLSIVQRISTILNLEIAVSSVPGTGSTFSFIVRQGQGNAVAPKPTTAKAPTNHRRGVILLVEDDAGVRNATRLLLTVEGYAVTAVTSLAEAHESVQSGDKPELLITDYHLQNGETGLQVIAGMREVLGESLHVLLVTGDTTPVLRKLTDDSQLRLLSKPVNADELLGLLAEVFG